MPRRSRPWHLSLILCAILCWWALPVLAWNESARSPQQTNILGSVERLVATTTKALVIFDLDSTLFRNAGRHAAILRDFAKTYFPKTDLVKPLRHIQATQLTDTFDLRGMLVNDAHIPPRDADRILPVLMPFWTARFFGNDYLAFDTALPGAAEYVRALHAKGATIVYLTGRDEPQMRAGTLAKLAADGFSTGTRTRLLMKPASSRIVGKSVKAGAASDREWKAAALRKIARLGNVVASFDNEPAHINVYYETFHQHGPGLAVFLDTDHTPNPPPLHTGVQRIQGFLR